MIGVKVVRYHHWVSFVVSAKRGAYYFPWAFSFYKSTKSNSPHECFALYVGGGEWVKGNSSLPAKKFNRLYDLIFTGNSDHYKNSMLYIRVFSKYPFVEFLNWYEPCPHRTRIA